jgi:phosphate transport system ATP-binding protein
MDFCYGDKAALHGIHLDVEYHRVTALIGPSGCGKSTLLRCINRMNDRVAGAHVSKGEILVKGKNIHDADVDLTQLRKQVGMVFQKSNPFPKTIFENVAYGLRVHGVKDKIAIDEAVEPPSVPVAEVLALPRPPSGTLMLGPKAPIAALAGSR